MPIEEVTYREGIAGQLKHFENDVRDSLSRLETSQEIIDKKVTYTNGKVRKLIIALVLLAGVVIGQALTGKEIITAFIHSL